MSSATYRVEDVVGFANTVITSLPTYVIGPEKVTGGFPNINDAGTGTNLAIDLAASLSPDGAVNGDQFGSAVAAGSNKIVISATENDTAATNGGAVYVYNIDFSSPFKLTANDAGQDDAFGFSVAVNSGRIVVGAPEWDNGAISNFGKIYIYDLNGNLINGLAPSPIDGNANGLFGWSVAVGNDRIVVGSIGDNDTGADSGAVYIYDLNGTLIRKITAFDGSSSRSFGRSVAVGNGRIVVGAPFDTFVGDGGAIYIYDIDGNLIIKRTEAPSGSRFGFSVSVGCGRIIVGAPFATISGVSFGGAVYVYDINGQTLIVDFDVTNTSDTGVPNVYNIIANDQFGTSVAVNNGVYCIGKPFGDANVPSSNFGEIYVLKVTESSISTSATSRSFFVPTYTNAQVGNSVAIGSGRVIAGGPGLSFAGANEGVYLTIRVDNDSNVYWDNILETYKY